MNGIQKQDFLILIRLPVIKNIGSDVLTLNKTKSISYSSKIQPLFVYNLQLTVTLDCGCFCTGHLSVYKYITIYKCNL
jgi:hypothetical protein